MCHFIDQTLCCVRDAKQPGTLCGSDCGQISTVTIHTGCQATGLMAVKHRQALQVYLPQIMIEINIGTRLKQVGRLNY